MKKAVTITEPAAVAALEEIYSLNGPGGLKWDFSVPGQVTALDGRVSAMEGALTGLNLDAAELTGILKLHDIEELAVLDAGWNDLEGVDFKKLPNLKELSLVSNNITDLTPLAGLTALTFLAACENKITDLSPLAGLTALTRLEASKNKITDLSPLAELTTLTDLSVDENKITELSPLTGLTALKCLELSYNKIIDLKPLAGLTALTYLRVDDILTHRHAENSIIMDSLSRWPGFKTNTKALVSDAQNSKLAPSKSTLAAVINPAIK